MRNVTILLILFLPFLSMGQKKAFYKNTLITYEIKGKDTMSKTVFVTYLDSLKNTITTEENIDNTILGNKKKPRNRTSSVIVVNTNRLYISADINSRGDTTGKIIYVFDEKGNRTENYQMIFRDTVNSQKRIYNDLGQDIKLYDKDRISRKYYLSAEFDYDKKGNMIEWRSYNKNGKITRVYRYKNTYGNGGKTTIIQSISTNNKDFIKQFKKVKKKNITTTYFYENSVGYNYGIRLNHLKGGFSIHNKDTNGNLKDFKLYDDKKKLIVWVKQIEEKIY